MSKKKNTLRDLDDFLKQQASLLVVPELNAMQAAAEPLPPEISSGNQVTAVPGGAPAGRRCSTRGAGGCASGRLAALTAAAHGIR